MIDFSKIKSIYKLGRNLDLGDVQVLFSAAGKKSFDQGDYLFRQGSKSRMVYLITKGLVRTFKINERGEEISIKVFSEHQIVANIHALMFDQESEYNYECMEAVSAICIDYDQLQQIIDKHPKLEKNRKYILQRLLKESFKRVESFVLLNPEERYLKFIEDNPGLMNRVPNKYIANMLGITPVSLSRIRKRIAEKKR